MRFVVYILTLSLLMLSTLCAQDDHKLTYLTENYPPANYMENDTLKGFSVDLLKLIWKKMGQQEQPITVMPWVRGYNYTLKNRNYVLFTMGMLEERRNLFKWVGPIFTAKQVLVARAKNDIQISSAKDINKFRIGVIRNDIAEKALINLGVNRGNLEAVVSFVQNIKKLDLNRIDCLAFTEDGFFKYLTINSIDPNRYKIVYVLKETEEFYAFNKSTPDHVIKAFQDALESLKSEHYAILKDYNMVQ